ncbi:uncharacterized protein [Gossypium hirsutum]|uniref:Uncharacterized protein n=1 Tax=Gossypium hirsutum TaxID=3635 RepID=A0A1U8I4U2_GOSHI|nr:uncharacterized protein LOC107892682 [Gossypium hirsutum]
MQVQLPLLEKETTMLFINTLKAPFITHMIGSTTKSFTDIVMAGEMIENAIRGGKIEGEAAKRPAPRRKDNEVNNISSFNLKAVTVSQPKVATSGQQSTQRQESGSRQNSERMQFTPIPVTYREYHAGISGHSIENCTGFKKAIERLIKNEVLKFESTSNTENPLPNHDNQGVNAIVEAGGKRGKENAAEVRMHLKVIWKEMVKRGIITFEKEGNETRNYCEFHGKEGHETQNCEEFKALVQGFIDNKELQIFENSSYKREINALEGEQQGTSRPRIIISLPGNKKVEAPTVPKVIIHKPNPFPYKDDKRVPWNYDCSITVPKGESIASAFRGTQNQGSHTRSGKRYDTGGIRMEPTKTKDIEIEKEKATEIPINESVNEEEAKEFLKFLKHSEYSMVKQLRKQPARISVLALLLSSEVHKNALLKVLNETYVTHDISVNKLDRLVNNIRSTKTLHITTRCKGYTLPSVLVDNGSALNVLPLSTLNRLPIDSSHMKACHNVVKDFDGTERRVMGQIDIPLEIGPNKYEVDFLVMDIKPSYNYLLGRLWIHSAGTVPSSLHQKLKLVTDGRLITINAEEDIIAAVTNKAPYVEANEEAIECSFRSLEIVNATFVSEGSEVPVPRMSRATRMALQIMVGRKALPGRGLGKHLQ